MMSAAVAGAIIDGGADFRLTDAGDWQCFYGSEHAGSGP